MKTIFKISAVLALMFVTTSSMATEPKIDLKTGNEGKSLVLEMDAVSETSEIRMTDSNDNIVHYETITKNSYAKKFNLKNLENGNYYFTVESPSKKVTYSITLKNREIKIFHKKESSQIPVLRVSGDRVYFNLLNKDEGTVRIRVLNGNGESLKSQVFKGNINVGKVFNFENALEDNYLVVVQDGKSVHRQSISVK